MIQLWGRPLSGGAVHPLPLDELLRGWTRTSREPGGFWTATGQVLDAPAVKLMQYFERWLGMEIRETVYGLPAWEGLIYDLRLVLDGVEYRRTLDSEFFHNAVTVVYSTNIGERAQTDAAEDADSRAVYGDAELYISLGGATEAAAEALRDRHIVEFGYPRTRASGGITVGDTYQQADGLYVTCAGFWATLNWRYRTTSLSANNASTHVATLVGASQLVTAGEIVENALQVYVDANPNPRRLGDALAAIAQQGDAAGNTWLCGVYRGRRLRYAPVETEPALFLRGGRLITRGGGSVIPALVRPGFWLRNADAPGGVLVYVDEVEYARETNLLSLMVYGEEESVVTLSAQILQGGRDE